jgi:transcriptional regulator with XRE-family HTH domain
MPRSTNFIADPFDIAVGARIRLFRKQRRVTQTQLADALHVSFQQVQKYEAGYNRVSASALSRIAAKLGVSMGALLGEDFAPTALAMDCVQIPSDAGAELARAFAEVRSPSVRRQIIQYVQSLAEDAHA